MSVIHVIENKYKKPHVVDVRSGDTVKIYQKIKEGNKERIQVFEGLVIKAARKGSLSSSITVRRIASGVGVEKTYLIHSPLITKIQVVKRSRVRRNYLSYMRERTGKSARLSSVDFDQETVNKVPEEPKPKVEKQEAEDNAEAKPEQPEKAEPNNKTEEKPAEKPAKQENAKSENSEKSPENKEAPPKDDASSPKSED